MNAIEQAILDLRPFYENVRQWRAECKSEGDLQSLISAIYQTIFWAAGPKTVKKWDAERGCLKFQDGF